MKMKMEKGNFIVVSGEYTGRIGRATKPNDLGLVMFYPKEGRYPYAVCLYSDFIKPIA